MSANEGYEVTHYSRAPWEREVGKNKIEKLLGKTRIDEDEVISFSDNMKLKRWEKFLDHPSELPD